MMPAQMMQVCETGEMEGMLFGFRMKGGGQRGGEEVGRGWRACLGVREAHRDAAVS